MRALYISHNGMTEPLGQSQVLPYLIGLSRRGVAIEILSFEKAGTSPEATASVAERLKREGIEWQSMTRSPSHGLPRKASETASAMTRALVAALRRRPDIVHARSYLPAAAGDMVARLVPGARLLFDVRGMLAEEAVDGGAWAPGGLRFRLVKAYERHLFHRTAGMVVLTEALRSLLRCDRLVPERTPIEVIPCCVDTDRFRVDAAARDRMRAALGLGDRTVVVYSGTLGSWYKAREMARFVGLLRRDRPDAALLVLTHHDSRELVLAARGEGLGDGDVVVRRVAPADMPSALSAGDLGLSFIQPCFSKLGSSPTKVAEYLAAGLPVVVNDGVGDQADLAAEASACVVLPSFEPGSLEAGASQAAAILRSPRPERAAAAHRVASARFSLSEIGIPRYLALYEMLCAASMVPPMRTTT